MTVADFSGYVTKANLECTDGRTIMPQAFENMDGMKVPLVWQHGHKDPKNVLGHVLLEKRSDGVYGYGYFNGTEQGKNSKALVEHEDVKALSIYANQLGEKAKKVYHGIIREVSLCLAGANPGAFIENITLAHGDGEYETIDDAAIMSFGLALEHEDGPFADDEDLEHATAAEIYDTLTEEQKAVVNFMIGTIIEEQGAQHSDGDNTDDENTDGDNTDNLGHLDQEGSSDMTRNVFEQQNGGKQEQEHVLSHDAMHGLLEKAKNTPGATLKSVMEGYALEHGITNIEVLFPEAKNVSNTPEWNKRQMEWVSKVLGGTSKTPFSRIKSVVADITMESARALGYIKGSMKKEEWFSVSKRTTTPTTIYKKQKLDRDDIIDITDFDVVPWMKGEMRMMLEEEIARAILISDGRAVDDEDKIKDPVGASEGAGIRSILFDHELYATTVNVNVNDASSNMFEIVDTLTLNRRYYRGSGTPTLYTTNLWVSKMLLQRDTLNRRLWRSKAELATELNVEDIVEVEVMETMPNLIGILVNLRDYNIGADKGGEVTLFDDFDIDFNQYKYLIETRISGALVKIKSALILQSVASNKALIVPTSPTFNSATGVITIPTQTGTTYKDAEGNTLAAGAQTALDPGESFVVVAVAGANYYYENSQVDNWSFTRDPA